MAGRRPCGGAGYTTAASNKIPREGSDDDSSREETLCLNAKKPMPRRLRELVERARPAAEEEERSTRDIDQEPLANVEVCKPELEDLEEKQASLRSWINKLRYGMKDRWEAAYIEIEEPCDMVEMVEKALKASGFTGKEKRFRELPGPR
jgi:hypothetical protein